MFVYRYLILLMLLGFFPAAVLAQEAADGPLGLEKFPKARTLFDKRQSDGDYTLALGVYKNLDGRQVVERERHLKGQLLRKTLELPSDYSAREGFKFYREQLKSLKARQLFYCAGRECGASNTWANTHFNVIQLYGLDEYQYYGVYEVRVDRSSHYVTLYAVQRGNKRVYLQLDIMTPEEGGAEQAIASNPNTLARLLREQGYVVFPGLQVSGTLNGKQEQGGIELTGRHLDSLVELLKQHSEWRLALVGHDYGAPDLASQRRLSLSYAQSIKVALQERGVAAERLKIYGLGSLAPAGRGTRSARVEVVLLPTSTH